jgi:thiocyanate desulfurase
MSGSIHRRRLLQLLGGSFVGAGAYTGLGLAARQERDAIDRDCRGGKLWDLHHELFGKWILLSPEKLGGGTQAVDLAHNQTLAWIAYWNYGDTCPISHHLAAYPSDDPYKGFEFINSTQGGENLLIYGIPTRIKQMGLLDRFGQGNHIYRVKYDGAQMELVEDIAESTGIGLGVHTVIYPDAAGFACADGQKDIAAFFNRARGTEKTKVLMAFRGDWKARDTTSLERCWSGGGTLRLARLVEPKETGKYEFEGTKGNKINWEMVPMAELLVERGQIPGDSPETLTGLDAVVHHPNNRWSAVILRMCSAALIVDRSTWEPVTCLHMPKGSPGNLPVKKVGAGPDTWEVTFEDVKNPAHEAGFSPDGNNFVMMNNLRQNNIAVFDTSDPDPRQWKKLTFVEDPEWVGEYPSPFHVCFSMDRSKMFVSVLSPKPRNSESWVVDTRTWKVIKKFKDIGPDCQTMAVSYDGKYVFQVYSGFQRLSNGLFVFTQDTLEPLGFFPNFGGHHDCVVVPTKVEHLLNSRCTTL